MAPASTFEWGGKTWKQGDLEKFQKWLKGRNRDWRKWKKNNPTLAKILAEKGRLPNQPPTAPDATIPPQPGLPGHVPDGITHPVPDNEAELPDDDIIEFETIFPGLPTDVAKQVYLIFKNGGSAAQAIAYVRGTQWHKDTYAGFGDGFRLGLFGDEAGYRAYHNAANLAYRQFLGRDATVGELAEWIKLGLQPVTVGQKLQGQSFAESSRDDWQYLAGAFGGGRLSEQELLSLGEQQAGLSSTMGDHLSVRLQQAQERARRVFEGVLASPSVQLGSGGLSAPSLLPKQRPDVGR